MLINVTVMWTLQAVLWIRIGFNADPDLDQAFDLNADPDPDPWSQTNADPDIGQTWRSKKVKFLNEKYTWISTI